MNKKKVGEWKEWEKNERIKEETVGECKNQKPKTVSEAPRRIPRFWTLLRMHLTSTNNTTKKTKMKLELQE